jgi:hypothetical protein
VVAAGLRRFSASTAFYPSAARLLAAIVSVREWFDHLGVDPKGGGNGDDLLRASGWHIELQTMTHVEDLVHLVLHTQFVHLVEDVERTGKEVARLAVVVRANDLDTQSDLLCRGLLFTLEVTLLQAEVSYVHQTTFVFTCTKAGKVRFTVEHFFNVYYFAIQTHLIFS